jgi:23S rRNA (cytidine1920-2'-O)/16S rRNA (cytidine1409-2'-O)-methyltransferase
MPARPMTSRKRADQVLVARALYDSRAKAQEAIAAGLVRVDGQILKKPSDAIDPNGVIEAEKPYPWVSRGGVKLAHALSHFGVHPHGQICLDAGASTGGFSHVLLEQHAAHCVAVDVGHDQLHHSLRAHPRLTVIEGQDIRTLSPQALPEAPTLVVTDVSFISLTLVLPALSALAAETATLIALIKPQFEVGKAHIGKKGLVKDPQVQQEICEKIRTQITELGWTVMDLIPSPITGGDGNQEFLLCATRQKSPHP